MKKRNNFLILNGTPSVVVREEEELPTNTEKVEDQRDMQLYEERQ